MAFDQPTRNRLARFVSEARSLLTEEFTRQLQHEYGIDPASGEVTALEKLTALDDARRETARILRETAEYYLTPQPPLRGGVGERRKEALERILREQAFTVLNRLCALRMAEARGIILEAVAQGYKSKGFQLYARLAGSALGETGDAYRSFLFSLFDELATELPPLFDRFSPQGRLFPREPALLRLLDLLNDPELETLWAEDETIGWIYQYFNSKEERQAMRAASQAPRNSRELAVRNQFFTPRYVVEFLTDNTLGRIWYEMTKGETALKDACRYLVRRPVEIFLQEGETAPETLDEDAGEDEKIRVAPRSSASNPETGRGGTPLDADKNRSSDSLGVAPRSSASEQEELLRQPVYIPHRPLKDPREIKMLDPACGSMHFGLYAFDLYEQIYREAWELEARLGADALWRPADLASLHRTYPDRETFLRDVPRLILLHNIHGIDIDPRATQIAGLSLWLRAQKSWQAQGVKAGERPQIRKSNIVCAEPMPGDRAMLEEFLGTLKGERLEALMRQVMPGSAKLRATPAMAAALAKLVRTVWQEMELAGEAGSLLKIEETLRQAVAAARKESEQKAPLFRVLEYGLEAAASPEETAGDFWAQAEALVLAALQEYAGQASNGQNFRRRLFAGDATQGFAFIDLCRKRYDLVVMNPPFGELTIKTKLIVENTYPNSKGNILAHFLNRASSFTIDIGRVGAIVSRTCFYLTTLNDFRSSVLERFLFVDCFSDLGSGVLDAMVETAAVIFRRTRTQNSRAIFFRQLVSQTKATGLYKDINSVNEAKLTRDVFVIDPQKFSYLDGAPYVYWITPRIIRRLASFPTLEPEGCELRVGLQTGDDYRFLRLWYEVPPNKILIAPDIGSEKDLRTSCLELTNEGKDWVFYSKMDEASPFAASIHLLVNWSCEGKEIKAFHVQNGSSISRYVRSESRYFAPGVSYMFRTSRLVPYVVPKGVIPTAGRSQIYPQENREKWILTLVASNVASAVARFRGETFGQPVFQNSMVASIPFIELPSDLIQPAEDKITSVFESQRSLFTVTESCIEFVAIPKDLVIHHSPRLDRSSLLGSSLDYKIGAAFGFNESDMGILERDLFDSVYSPNWMSGDNPDKLLGSDGIQPDNYDALRSTPSYLLGCVLGRWNVYFTIDENNSPKLLSPFSPLPACPPGMLQNAQGLPAAPEDVPADYPLRITWGGILVDDEGHPEDVEARVREALHVIWQERAEAIEAEACQILGVRSLREYFRKPGLFFADHLKRYSKSRRAAPIYWPLSTPSGSYTLWLYYHRLSDQTLFTCVNDFVDPKLQQVAAESARLRQKTGRSAADEKELERLSDLERELKDFRLELLRVAAFWKPNLNDGVEITASPLWRLFQHKPWQKRLKETWGKLEAGDYDWAHLAYSIWPERVREKCKTDKSLAIAHDLEHLYVEPAPGAKKKARRKKKEEPEMEGFLDED